MLEEALQFGLAECRRKALAAIAHPLHANAYLVAAWRVVPIDAGCSLAQFLVQPLQRAMRKS